MASTHSLPVVASDPRDEKHRLFPVLSPAQLARASRSGSPRACAAGEVLVAPGAQSRSIFVIVRGQIDVVRPVHGQEELYATLTAGQFTGEISTLAGQPALVLIRAATASEVVEIGREAL